MKNFLQLEIQLKGQCKGITTVQVERTPFKALYKRSDNYWECFFINVINERTLENGKWKNTGNTKEHYPNENDFGITSWCGKEFSIRNIYKTMNDGSK